MKLITYLEASDRQTNSPSHYHRKGNEINAENTNTNVRE